MKNKPILSSTGPGGRCARRASQQRIDSTMSSCRRTVTHLRVTWSQFLTVWTRVHCTRRLTPKRLHSRRDSIDVKKRRHIVRTRSCLLLSSRSCLTSASALSTSVRTRLKMFTDRSSVQRVETILGVFQICSFPLSSRQVLRFPVVTLSHIRPKETEPQFRF